MRMTNSEAKQTVLSLEQRKVYHRVKENRCLCPPNPEPPKGFREAFLKVS